MYLFQTKHSTKPSDGYTFLVRFEFYCQPSEKYLRKLNQSLKSDILCFLYYIDSMVTMVLASATVAVVANLVTIGFAGQSTLFMQNIVWHLLILPQLAPRSELVA